MTRRVLFALRVSVPGVFGEFREAVEVGAAGQACSADDSQCPSVLKSLLNMTRALYAERF